MAFLEALNLSKTYKDRFAPLEVLRGVNLCVEEGTMVAILGASGCGKSTLLHILGGLDEPTSGRVLQGGTDIHALSNSKKARLRNTQMGFVFQFFHLLPEFTALENVMLPALIAGLSRERATREAGSALAEMSLTDRSSHRPAQMSGGEQQRVALARAAVMRPKMIFADEPTGNLDAASGLVVWDYLKKLNRSEGSAVVVVTHNEKLADTLDLTYTLSGGELSPRAIGRSAAVH